MTRHVRYREISYDVGFCSDQYEDRVDFFPLVQIDGVPAARAGDAPVWPAPLDDPKMMSLAYGAAKAYCDRENASLQDRGMNRVREVL